MPLPGPDRNFCRFASLLGAALAIAPAPAVCAPQDTIVRRDWGIGGFKAPPRWELQPLDRPTYPQLLAWAGRGQGAERAVITLVARRLMPGTSVERFAHESAALQDAGVRNVTLSGPQLLDRWGRRMQLDGVLEGPGGRRLVRQLFLINGAFGYVLTLVAPQSQALPRYRDLETVASDLEPMAPVEGAPAAPAPPLTPPPSPAQDVSPVQPGEGPR